MEVYALWYIKDQYQKIQCLVHSANTENIDIMYLMYYNAKRLGFPKIKLDLISKCKGIFPLISTIMFWKPGLTSG